MTVAFTRGMEIVVKRTPGAEFAAAQLFIRGGSRNWTADNAGIEHIALSVATSGGTQSMAKGPLSRKLASLGATIIGDAGNDFSSIGAKAPVAVWDDLFPIFVDTFLAPALPSTEFEIVKQRELSARRHESEDGDGRLWLLARRAVFAGHPYANRPIGTVETIDAMKPADLGAAAGEAPGHQPVGARRGRGSGPRSCRRSGEERLLFRSAWLLRRDPRPPLHFAGSHVSGDPFKLPTNYVESMFAAPAWNDPDFIPMWLGMVLLGQRVFDEVRTKRNLSYAPSAYMNQGLSAPFGVMYVTSVDPSAAMKVMFDEARRLQSELIPAKELDGSKAVFLSGYLQGHEAVDGQAYDLGNALLLGGDWHLASTNLDRLRATTPEAVRDAARRWFANVQTAIVGDPSKLDAGSSALSSPARLRRDSHQLLALVVPGEQTHQRSGALSSPSATSTRWAICPSRTQVQSCITASRARGR